MILELDPGLLERLLVTADAAAAWVVGAEDGRSYVLGRWAFLRALGLVYLVAFLSLWRQLPGLYGERGILPVSERLESLRRRGSGTWSRAPSLFWIDAGDRALHLGCALGVVASALLVLNVAPAPSLLALWALYLSFAAVGREFLSYQWDVLLLEAGFLAVFLAPWELTPGLLPDAGAGGAGTGASLLPFPALALLLLWWLLFRLNFQSGVGKLASGDPAWRDLTALDYHFWTQPLPTWTAWWADKAPAWSRRASVAATHLVEIGLPFLIFGPREARLAACAGIVLLQVLIFLTGNYNFFNLLTVALALLLVDDGAWASLWPGALPAERGSASGGGPGLLRVGATAAAAAVWIPLGALRVWRTVAGGDAGPRWAARLLRRLAPFRTLNSYGLFRVMTKRRPEIVVEGSRDGRSWRAYEFRYKPGDPERRPRFAAPHQPRLDWQMWFAALGTFERSPWFGAFVARLLEGSPPVRGLLEEDPFGERPPRYVRARLYEYRFTTRRERAETGRWWRREEVGAYGPVLSREDGPEG